ncbi:MAG TPA: MEDS domain-containing protein [Gemmatimonadales bacterium]|nr:MEDS domain-containing protein [Gemmatimonadales bacterium]
MQHLLDNPKAEAHIVQLYGKDDRLLARNVARYLSEGLRRGDGLLVIATPEHSGSFARLLREDPAYSKAVLEGRLVFLDAQATLNRFMVNGQPDRERFQTVIGEAVRDVQHRAGHTGVRAYGEMVGVLWKAGQYAAAVRLEEFWNDLLKSNNASLFCAYPIDVFGEEFQVDTVDQVLCAHKHMLPVEDALESALNQAMNEVLGDRMIGLRGLIKANYRPSWGAVPKSEAIILWLRNNLPGSAGEILELARQYYAELGAGNRELEVRN